MTAPFVAQLPGGRVVFGAGACDRVAGEVEALGAQRVMLIAGGSAAGPGARIAEDLGERCVAEWTEVTQHVPADLAERARSAATDATADAVVCVGGGSAIGLAKAIALTHEVQVVAVPTTYAGSEQTTIYGITASADGLGHKQTGRDPRVLPRTVVYDPELTLGLPAHVTGPSAFNALAHSVEALYAPGHNPVVTVIALEAVTAIARSLPAVMSDPSDIAARSDLFYGAYLSGIALGATSAAFHHKICHVLGGTFDLVHADAHSVVLPHALAFNAPALPAEMARLATALGVPGDDPARALWDLAVRSDVPTRLADLRGSAGPLRRADLAEAARRVVAERVDNPRPYDEADVLDLLERAFDGEPPRSSINQHQHQHQHQ